MFDRPESTVAQSRVIRETHDTLQTLQRRSVGVCGTSVSEPKKLVPVYCWLPSSRFLHHGIGVGQRKFSRFNSATLTLYGTEWWVRNVVYLKGYNGQICVGHDDL